MTRAQPPEPLLRQAVLDHVDRRALLADEEHPAATRHLIGHQVDDRLRLAGARRTLDDEALAGARQGDRAQLRGIPIHHVVAILERHLRRLGGERARAEGEEDVEGLRWLGRPQERAVVADQGHLPVVQVRERDADQIEGPAVGRRLAGGILQVVVLPLHLADLGDLPEDAGPRLLQQVALRGRGGQDDVLEELDAQGRTPLARVGVVVAMQRAHAASGEARAPLVGLELAPRDRLHERDPRAVHALEDHGGLGRGDLLGQGAVELGERLRLREIHRGGQGEAVELLQVMGEDRVHLGELGGGLQRVRVAHALALHQTRGHQQERRGDALLRLVLQVVPVEEADHEAQLREAVLRRVAGRIEAQSVQRGRDEGVVLEAQPAGEGEGLLGEHRLAGSRRLPRSPASRARWTSRRGPAGRRPR